MIKQGIRNFFSSLKYVFTPLGVLTLGMALGLSVLLPVASDAVRGLVASVKEIAVGVEVDFPALKDAVFDAVRALDWSKPLSAVRTLCNREWLIATLSDCVHSLMRTGEEVVDQIAAAVGAAASQIVAGLVVLLFCTLLGILCGYLLTKWLVRRNVAKRAWWKFFPVMLLDSLIASVYVMVSAYLQALWPHSIWFTGILLLLFSGLLSLLQAYWIHGKNKVRPKDVINFKNAGLLFLTDAIVFLIAAVMVALVFALTNTVVGLFVAVPLVEIALLVISLNAEAYVKNAAAAHGVPSSDTAAAFGEGPETEFAEAQTANDAADSDGAPADTDPEKN